MWLGHPSAVEGELAHPTHVAALERLAVCLAEDENKSQRCERVFKAFHHSSPDMLKSPAVKARQVRFYMPIILDFIFVNSSVTLTGVLGAGCDSGRCIPVLRSGTSEPSGSGP